MGTLAIPEINVTLPEWSQCLFEDGLDYVAIHGGRGSGKSQSVGTVAVMRALQRKTTFLCVREIKGSIKNSLKANLDNIINKYNLGSFFRSTEVGITCKLNGSKFLFAGLYTNVESIQSVEGIDFLLSEESHALSALSLQTLIPSIRQEGCIKVFLWNPQNKTDPIDVMFRGENIPPKTKVIEVNYMDNPWFPDTLRRQMEFDKLHDPDKYSHVWMGGYKTRSDAQIYKNWRVEAFETPKDADLRGGVDFGFSTSAFAANRLFVKGNTVYIDYEVHKMHPPTLSLPDLLRIIPQFDKINVYADNARPESIHFLRSQDFPKLFACKKGKGSVEDGIEFLRSFDIVVHPRCEHTIAELSGYSYKVDRQTLEVTNTIIKENDHHLDAIRYALEPVQRAIRRVNIVRTANVVPIAHHWG